MIKLDNNKKGRETMKTKKTTATSLIVSSGQYETCATTIAVRHTTTKGLMRRAKQLSNAHAYYGDNWEGWIPARVAIADPRDEWGDNDIIGGQWCHPTNGWLELV